MNLIISKESRHRQMSIGLLKSDRTSLSPPQVHAESDEVLKFLMWFYLAGHSVEDKKDSWWYR